MGGCDFQTSRYGKTAKEAFASAVADARYESGHGGYTGTIAEKPGFVLIDLPAGAAPRDAIGWIADPAGAPEERRAWATRWARQYEDKWGDACCVRGGQTKPDGSELFIFFGVASS